MHRASYSRALFAGFVGAFVASALMTVGRSLGMAVHLEMLLGSLVTHAVGPATWLIGLLLFLGVGTLLGGLYGLAFGAWLRGGSILAGVLLAVPHTLCSGALIAWMPPPPVWGATPLAAPGPFLSALGMTGVIVFVGVHLGYGGLVGWLLGQPKPRRGRARLMKV